MKHSEPGGSTNAIEVEDLRKTYRGGVEALRGLSFEVRSGEIFALLGPNGAGKSTTVRILTTLASATGGSARVAGLDVASDAREVRRRIGYIAQGSGGDPLITGRENLQLQGQIFRLPPKRLRQRIDELLALFQLEDAAARMVETYSGGMRRRLDVAMGLIHQPEVLFLDEPTTGLDPKSRSVMWKEVERLAREGLTILLTTHYLEEADHLAQRLAIIDHGSVVVAGSPDELKGGLRGDLVSIELRDRDRTDEARATIEAVDGVSRVLRTGVELYAQVDQGTSAVPAVVGALEKAGLEVAQISLSRPSLDDVYLTATGQVFQQGGASASSDDL
ncbi:MAG: ATP-binding cassette domain-containing protein [bacterium]|nr:ATP-binding cassette domain-containing protein [bacterium]